MSAAIREVRESYFVVMIDYGFDVAGRCKGREAIVDPEITRREVISRIRSGEYPAERISFIHSIADGEVTDVTGDIIVESRLPEIRSAVMRQMFERDHVRGLREGV